MKNFTTIDEYTILNYTWDRLLEIYLRESDRYDELPNELTKARRDKYKKQLDEIHDAILEIEKTRYAE